MTPQMLASNGELTITPSPSSSSNDFDFFVGKWNIHNRKLKARLQNCTDWLEFEATGEMKKILNGLGNTDDFITTIDGQPFEGRTLRLFNPRTKLWSIYWADSGSGILLDPVVGSFDGQLGMFYGKDMLNGVPVLVVYQWDRTDPENPVWSQAFSADEGKTWEWNWYMYMRRA
jgi:hypothetical protein